MATLETDVPSTGPGAVIAPTRPAAWAAVPRNLLRKIWGLDKHDSRREPFNHTQPGWLEFEIAHYVRDCIAQLKDKGESGLAVLFLQRAAASFLIRAHMARAGRPLVGEAIGDAVLERARQLPTIQEAWSGLSTGQTTALVAALGPSGDVAICDLPSNDRSALSAALQGFVETLHEPLEAEANQMSRTWVVRFRRATILTIVLLAIAVAVWHFIEKTFPKPNLALHRPVEVSSHYPGLNIDDSRLVDGDTSIMGFHTQSEGQQFVIIDLGSVKRFEKVVVYNVIGAQDRAAPLRLEVSSDHIHFTELDQRVDVFDKWVSSGLHAKGRYIRLMNRPSTYFHLNEVEVY
jgi:hypothetical protein